MKVRIITLIMLFLHQLSHGQVVINEIMASNWSTVQDNSGAFSDWVELYNSGNNEIDLNNYFISDNPEKLDKFQLKSTNGSLKIASKGYLIIWCSGFTNRGNNHVSFSLSANSESIILSNPELKIVNQLDFSDQRKDISFGRTTNGGNEIRYFVKATAGKSNLGAETYLGVLTKPIFSQKAGFYSSSFNLSLTHSEPGVKIVFSTDGSIPDPLNLNGKTYNYKNQYIEKPGQSSGPLLTSSYKSNNYQSPIEIKSKKTVANKISQISSTWHFSPFYLPNTPIPKATVVRALATKPGYLSSEIATETYFLDENNPKNPEFDIISLNIQEDDLFSYDYGIYNAGKMFDNYRIKNPTVISEFCTPGNFTQEGDEFERPVNFEIFRNNKSSVNQNISFKIHGACSRSNPYKSMRLYGKNDFDKFPFFPNNPDLFQDNFILRNSGDDFTGTLIRDVFVHDLVGHFNFGSQKSQPAVVYMNGEYWGIQNIRERLDKYYLNRKYGVNMDNIDLRKVIWDGPSETEYGDEEHFNEMMKFLNTNDLSSNEIYEKAITYIDPKSLIDYQIAEIFTGNIDWPQNNVRLWRNKTPNYAPFAASGLDGRWRFLFYDADKSLGMIVNAQHDALHEALKKEENAIFKAFMRNDEFKNKFILRFLDLLNTSFDPEHSLKIFKNLVKKYAPEVPNHLNRWRTINNLATWENNTKIIETYLYQRPESTKKFLKDNLGQFQERILTVTTSDTTMGYVRVNSIDINSEQPGVAIKKDGSWNGKYFSEIPFTILAKPLPGHRFLYWEHANQKISDSLIVVFLNQDESYTAYYEQIALADESTIPPASLADCGYFLNEWSSFSAKGSTPANARFVFLNQRDPTNSSKITGFTSGEFNHNTKSRIVGLEKNGISFINTSGPSEHEGYPYGQLGGIVVAVNTIGLDSAWISWTAKTILPGDRKHGLKLLYRIGSTDDFRELDPKTNYLGSKTANHTSNFVKIPIPKAAINQPYVQFFWKYYFTGEGKNGPRDEIGLDDISFHTNLDTPLAENGGRISVEGYNGLPNLGETNKFKIAENNYKITSDNYFGIRPKTPSISSKKTEVCGTEKLILKATGCTNGTIFWSNGEVGKEINVAEGGYFAYCSASCGVSENSNTIKINRVQKSMAPTIESNQERICEGESITLRANFCSGKVLWSNGVEGEKITVKPTENSYYSASCFANQCLSDESSKKFIQIGRPNVPTLHITKNDLCVGETSYIGSAKCDGIIEWSNKSEGQIIKFTAEKPGNYHYKARCKSLDGGCTSEWSESLSINVNEAENAPNTLAEIVYDCNNPKLDLQTAILDSVKSGLHKYIFQKGTLPNMSQLPNTLNVIPGVYYVYKKNEYNCTSPLSKITVKAPNCGSEFTKNLTKNSTNLTLDIRTASTQFEIDKEIEVFVDLKNIGLNKATNTKIQIEFPPHLDYIQGSSNGSFRERKLNFDFANLNSGNNVIVSFKTTSNKSTLTNITAKIIGIDQQDSDLNNNSDLLTILPYDCIGLSIREARSSLIGNDLYEKTLEISLENALNQDISPIQLNLNLNKYFGNGAEFISKSLVIEADEKLKLNPEYDGKAENDAILIDSMSVLLAQKTQKLIVKFRVDLSQSERKEYLISGKIHSRNNLVDISTAGDNPDPDHDGNYGNNYENTKLSFDKLPSQSAISVSQVIVDSVKINSYNHKYTFMVLIQNNGNVELKNIGLSNNLKETFGKNVIVSTFGITSTSKFSTTMKNTGFDGINNTAMLLPNNIHSLKPTEIDTLFYSIHINHKDNFGPFFHNVVATATSVTGQVVRDTSNNGFKILPHFADPTIVRFNNGYKDKVIIMGGFSPNDDKVNDELSIFIPNGIILEFLEIYNRWGTKVVSFNESHRQGNYIYWDGKNPNTNLNIVTEGTYYYSFKVRNDNEIYSNFLTIKE